MNMLMNPLGAGRVAEVTGLNPGALQNHLSRKVVIGHREGLAPIEGGGANGVRRKFTFENVMEIAIAKALTDAGVSDLEVAYRAASRFSHFAHGPVGKVPGRLPSFPFKSGRTLLVVTGSFARVFHWEPTKTDFLAIIRSELGRDLGHVEGFTLVDCSAVFDRVVQALGFIPPDVIAQAYRAAEGRGAE
jgi:hypothetical protein